LKFGTLDLSNTKFPNNKFSFGLREIRKYLEKLAMGFGLTMSGDFTKRVITASLESLDLLLSLEPALLGF
jgi:hypothetical protein